MQTEGFVGVSYDIEVDYPLSVQKELICLSA